MVQIIPAILATSEEEYLQKLKKIEDSGLFNDGWVQIDLMDNKFVQNESIRPEVIAKHPTNLKLEAQLMVEYPENWIDELVKIGIDRIVFPLEDTEGIEERIRHIKNHGIEVGISLNPETSVEKLELFIDTINLVLIMSVHPGFAGQEFIPETLEKVKGVLRLRSGNNNFVIEVDGGINESVVADLVKVGVDNLVIGSHLIDGDIEENLEKIWEKVNGYKKS